MHVFPIGSYTLLNIETTYDLFTHLFIAQHLVPLYFVGTYQLLSDLVLYITRSIKTAPEIQDKPRPGKPFQPDLGKHMTLYGLDMSGSAQGHGVVTNIGG